MLRKWFKIEPNCKGNSFPILGYWKGMNMEINIMNYMTVDEIHDICKEEVSIIARQMLRNEDELQRIMANASYRAVWDVVDRNFNADFNEMIASKIPSIINELSAFSVFRPANAWDRSESIGFSVLSKAVHDNANLIEDRAKKLIAQIDLEMIKDVVADQIQRVIDRLSSKDEQEV